MNKLPYATMTPDEAVVFDRQSPENAATIVEACIEKGCGCEPYEDVFTFNRWKAQGYYVKRGEHGIKIPVIVKTKDSQKPDKDKTLFRNLTVFCRCQVAKLGQV